LYHKTISFLALDFLLFLASIGYIESDKKQNAQDKP